VVGFDLGQAAEDVVDKHPATNQGLRALVDDDILQIDASVQAVQVEDEGVLATSSAY